MKNNAKLMKSITKLFLMTMMVFLIPMKHVGQTPYRQYADEGILLNFFEIDNHDFRLFLLYNLDQDDRFILQTEEESGLFNVVPGNDGGTEPFIDLFENAYNHALADFRLIDKVDLEGLVLQWKASVPAVHFTSITMDLAFSRAITVNNHCVDSDPFCTSDIIQFEAANTSQTADQLEDENGNIIVPKAIRYANHLHTLPNNVSTLDEYHRFGCLWMPEKVLFYVDGELVNEFDDPDLIPTHPMWLKITHLEDINARIGFDNNLDTIWGDWHDEMTIDYIRGYRLKTACDSDIVIRSIADFNSFVYNTKHTITMGGQNSPLTLPDTINFTMRAVESITIDGQFELPIGAQMTLMAQECPQCSMEGVDLPSYGCGMNNEDE